MQASVKKEETNRTHTAQQVVKYFEINFVYIGGEKKKRKKAPKKKKPNPKNTTHNHTRSKEGSSSFILTKGEELAKNVKVETTWLTEGIRQQPSQFFRRAKQRATK